MEAMMIDQANQMPDVIPASDIGDEIFGALASDATPPAAKPAQKPAPQPAKDVEDALGDEQPKAAPKPKAKAAPEPDVDPLSPEALAAAAAKREDALPDGLLKDDEIGKLPERKQRDAFAKERAAHKEARQRLQELTAKVNELSSKAQDAEQVAELRKQLEAREADLAKMNDEMARVDLTRSPEFRKQYDDKMNHLGQRMVQTLVAEGVEQAEAAALVRRLIAEKRPSVREYALDESAPSLKGTILAFLTQFDDVAQTRAAALEKAKETAAAIGEAESRARLAAMTGKVDQVAEKAAQEAAALGSPFYRLVKDNEEWNSGVERRKQALKGLLLSGDPEKLAPYVAEGLTAADMRARYVAQYNELQALKKEYADAIGHSPRLGQLRPSQTPPSAPSKRELGPGSIEDIVEEALMA